MIYKFRVECGACYQGFNFLVEAFSDKEIERYKLMKYLCPKCGLKMATILIESSKVPYYSIGTSESVHYLRLLRKEIGYLEPNRISIGIRDLMEAGFAGKFEVFNGNDAVFSCFIEPGKRFKIYKKVKV